MKSVADAEGETAEELVQQVEESPLMQDVKNTLRQPKATGCGGEMRKRLLELKLKLDEAADALEWPALAAEAREWIGYLEREAGRNGTQEQSNKASDLAAEVEDISPTEDGPFAQEARTDSAALLEIVCAGGSGSPVPAVEKQKQQMSDQRVRPDCWTKAATALPETTSPDCKHREAALGLLPVKSLKLRSAAISQV